MSWLITITVGIVIGYLYAWTMGKRIGIWHSIVTGILGAIAGYWLFVDVFGLGVMNTATGYFSGTALIWELIGAIVTLIAMSALQYETFETRKEAVRERAQEYGASVAHEYKRRRKN